MSVMRLARWPSASAIYKDKFEVRFPLKSGRSGSRRIKLLARLLAAAHAADEAALELLTPQLEAVASRAAARSKVSKKKSVS